MSIQAVLDITVEDPSDNKPSHKTNGMPSPLLATSNPAKKKDFVTLSAGGITVRCKLLKGVLVYPHVTIAGNLPIYPNLYYPNGPWNRF